MRKPEKFPKKSWLGVALATIVLGLVPVVLTVKGLFFPLGAVACVGLALVVVIVYVSPYMASRISRKRERSYPAKTCELEVPTRLVTAAVLDRLEKDFGSRRDTQVVRRDSVLEIYTGSEYRLRMRGVFSATGRDALPVLTMVMPRETPSGSEVRIVSSDELGWFIGNQGERVSDVAESAVSGMAQRVAQLVQDGAQVHHGNEVDGPGARGLRGTLRKAAALGLLARRGNAMRD
jgi:hypothetical protein